MKNTNVKSQTIIKWQKQKCELKEQNTVSEELEMHESGENLSNLAENYRHRMQESGENENSLAGSIFCKICVQ